jgi:tRNA-2-methylthio-N6-dimethylallyladenosine synthase
MDDQIPKEVVQERFERLVTVQNEIAYEENKAQIGRTVDVLVANGEGRKDAATHRMSGRAPDSRLVHFEVTPGSEIPRPGDIVSVTITAAAPFHLLADSTDGAPLKVRRTIAGDAWDRAEAESCGVPAHTPTTRASGAGNPDGRRTLNLGIATTPIYDVNDDER